MYPKTDAADVWEGEEKIVIGIDCGTTYSAMFLQ